MVRKGTLYAGGWSRDAAVKKGMAVIDLTGTKSPSSFEHKPPTTKGKDSPFANVVSAAEKEKFVAGPWLDFHIKDFGVPPWSAKVWKELSKSILELLEGGTDVLVACQGGHGRTGLAISILAHLLGEVPEDEDPILWTRSKHCEKAVESNSQIAYIYKVLGLPDNAGVKPAKQYTTTPTTWTPKTPAVKGKADKTGGDEVEESLPLVRHVIGRLLGEFEEQRSST